MIFPDSWLARFAHVTPQISPDNTLRHSGWSHSPDLAAPANSGGERKRAFPLICPICCKRRDSPTLSQRGSHWLYTLCFTQATDSISGAAGTVHTDSPNTISHYELKGTWNLWRMWQIHLPGLAQCCHFLVVFIALIAFVVEGWLNQAVATPNEMLIKDSEIHSLLIWCYFSRKMRIIICNATCYDNYSIIALSRCHRRVTAKNVTTPQGHFVTLHFSFMLLNAVLSHWQHFHGWNEWVCVRIREYYFAHIHGQHTRWHKNKPGCI